MGVVVSAELRTEQPERTPRQGYCGRDELSELHEFETVRIDGETRLVTPTDHTGLPYCFAPTAQLPEVRAKAIRDKNLPFEGRLADLNHQFPKYEVATSTDPVLTELGKRALTGCRVQWVDYWQHHGPYNNLFVGPDLPTTKEHLFRTIVMASAGYIPGHAIDLSGYEPKITRLTNKERKWLWTSGQVDVMCQTDISQFLLNYVLDSDLSHVDQVMLEEFIYSHDYDRRLKLGHALAAQAVETLIEPVEGMYRSAKKNNLLTFVRVGARKESTPDSARELVKKKLAAGANFNRVYNALIHRLAQEPRRSYRESLPDWAV